MFVTSLNPHHGSQSLDSTSANMSRSRIEMPRQQDHVSAMKTKGITACWPESVTESVFISVTVSRHTGTES